MTRRRRGPRPGTAWIAAALLLAGSWLNPRGTGALPVPVHFDPASVTPTPVSMTISGYLTFGGAVPRDGAEVAAYDTDGVLCGISGVDPTSGAFLLHVYGDDDTTPGDEGAQVGDALTLVAYDPATGLESSAPALTWSAAPPVFGDKGSFRRDADGPGPQDPDADGDGVADAADAFPDDVAASMDGDGDGFPGQWNPGYSQADSTTGLTLDAFPTDVAASADGDGDGYPDGWNPGYTQADSSTGLTLDLDPGHANPPLPVILSSTMADGGLLGPLELTFSPYQSGSQSPAQVRVAIDELLGAGVEPVLDLELPAPGYPVRLALPSGVLRAGRIYQVQLQYQDTSGGQSFWSPPFDLAVPATDPLDSDPGNGIQDSAELPPGTPVYDNGVDVTTTPGLVVLAEAESGTAQAVGLKPSVGSVTAAGVARTVDLPPDHRPPSNLDFPYGVFSFRIDGLTPGDPVDVTFFLPDPLPAGTRWFRFDPVNGAVDLTDRAVITGNRVVLTLIEGEPRHDADRVANGVLIDPSGPAVPAPPTTPAPGGGGGGGGCFVQTMVW